MEQAKTKPGVLAIRFQKLGKIYYFDAAGISDLKIGDYVIVSTSKGREMGLVADFVESAGDAPKGGWKPIERRANAQELVMARMWQGKELDALITCREKAAELKLTNLKILAAEYSYDGSRITFLVTTDGDDKAGIKSLRSKMGRTIRKSRVEVRQVGPRDAAKVLSGMGACGMAERCCARFMTEFSPISIKMAKAQGVSLNPQEITGMCGRLRCCLVYEFEQYVEARKGMPKLKKRVITPQGEGRVVDLYPLKKTVVVQLEDGMRHEMANEDLQPYEELKALKSKAKEPCSRHPDGNCSCNKKG
jgi:cell fate regulator YaaT (PSP1 superfamily)